MTNHKQDRILLIEDNLDHWVLTQQVVEEHFPKVDLTLTASFDQTLLQLMIWQRREWELPKLILLNLNLPNREDGWRLLKQIKNLGPLFQQIPIVIVCASSEQEDVQKSYELGASSYLIKPSNYQEWLACFTSLYDYWWKTVTLPPFQYR